jgi:hypothetical protein
MGLPRTPEDVEREMQRKAASVAEVLNSDAGKMLMEAVRAQFKLEPQRLIGKDPQETAYRVGAYDVVSYLEELQQYNTNKGAK